MAKQREPASLDVQFMPNWQGGVCSFIRWEEPLLHTALRRLFGTRPDEELVRVDVERDGLRAHFHPRAS